MAASTSLWASRRGARTQRNSRAWSSAAPTAASTSRAALVEVVPTAHYMMGGVEFAADCTTSLPGLFVAGEDRAACTARTASAAMAVANSTVFGAVAGDTMAAWVRKHGELASVPGLDIERYERSFGAAARRPRAYPRETLRDQCGSRVGIIRDGAGLRRALTEIGHRGRRAPGHGHRQRIASLHLGWHDWLNLQSLISVSRAIAQRRRLPRGLARCALPR